MGRPDIKQSPKTRILVVDDDHLLTAVASMALQANDYDVDEAGDGAMALSLIEKNDYGLIVLDLEMPNVNGFQVLEEVRAHPRFKHLPIIVVTSRADPIAIERSYELGATSFMVKPLKWNIMVHHVQYALRSSRMAEELRSSKHAAEEASQLKSNLLAMISHEFRTPIHAISGFADLIVREAVAEARDDNLLDHLSEITGASKRLNDMLGDILFISSNLNDASRMREERHVFTDLLDDTLAKVAHQNAGSRITVESDGSLPDGSELLCDRDMFIRAASHILNNALKFSTPELPIAVNTFQSAQGELVFSVSDQGPGMSEDHVKNALELFSQNDMSSTRPVDGLGLGLTLSNMICKAHGGRLTIQSVPGEGATISLVFPADRIKYPDHESKIAAA